MPKRPKVRFILDLEREKPKPDMKKKIAKQPPKMSPFKIPSESHTQTTLNAQKTSNTRHPRP